MSESLPPTVTINTAEYQQARKFNQLLDRLWTDPEVGEQVRLRAKAIDPTLPIPDEHPVAVGLKKELIETKTALDKMREEYEADRTTRTTEKEEANLRKLLGDVQSKRNLTDDGMAGTIKLMQERQIADPDAAALLYLDGLPKAKPQTASSRMFDTKANLFGTQTKDDQWEKLHVDPEGYFADVVNSVFEEMPPGS